MKVGDSLRESRRATRGASDLPSISPSPRRSTPMTRRLPLWFAALFAVVFATPVRAADPKKEAFAVPPEPGSLIVGARFSDDGKTVLTWGAKPHVAVWDAKTGKAV